MDIKRSAKRRRQSVTQSTLDAFLTVAAAEPNEHQPDPEQVTLRLDGGS